MDNTQIDKLMSIFDKNLANITEFSVKQFILFSKDSLKNTYILTNNMQEVYDMLALVIFKLPANSPLQKELILFLKENI